MPEFGTMKLAIKGNELEKLIAQKPMDWKKYQLVLKHYTDRVAGNKSERQ